MATIMRPAFVVKFPNTALGKLRATAFAKKCKDKYEEITGQACDQWCPITLERRKPDCTIETLTEYEVPVDRFVYEVAIEELLARLTT